jgi:Ricin-type beta-trefoil lectin domain-like
VDTRNGNTRANYRWAGTGWSGGGDDAGYNQPPSYRPPPSGGWGGGSGGGAYPPSGRVFYSGGIVNRASGKGLDVQDRSTRDAANVQQWDFGGGPNQTWDVIDQGGGRF